MSEQPFSWYVLLPRGADGPDERTLVHSWKRQQREQIKHSLMSRGWNASLGESRRVVCCTSKALESLPSAYSAQSISVPAPRKVERSILRNLLTESKDGTHLGTRHFAAGSIVYLGGRLSGDGGERVYFTGRSRDTGEFTSVIYERRRAEALDVVLVTDPEHLFAITGVPGYLAPGELEAVEAVLPFNWKATGWTREEWNTLTERCFLPIPVDATKAITRALACTEDRALELQQLYRVSKALEAKQKSYKEAGSGAIAEEELWEALAPTEWLGDRTVRYCDSKTPRIPRKRPLLLSHIVALCANLKAATTAEALAQELSVAWDGRTRTVQWIIAQRSRCLQLSGIPFEKTTKESLWKRLCSLPIAVREFDLDWRRQMQEQCAQLKVAPVVESLTCSIAALGYGVGPLTDETIALLCAEVP